MTEHDMQARTAEQGRQHWPGHEPGVPGSRTENPGEQPTAPLWQRDPPVSAPPPRPSDRKPGRRIAELSVVAVLAAALASGGTVAATRYADSAAPKPVTSSAASGQPLSGSSSSANADNPPAPVVQATGTAPDWTATAKAVAPSVVAITVSSRQATGQGSGVIIDKAGHVVTNNHVATGAGPNATINVAFNDGRTYSAKVVGTDPATDLAVLAIDGAPADLTPISIGNSDKLAVGEPVMAVGNPLGLAGTVTTGIISALDRPVSTGGAQDPSTGGGEPVVTNAIQTSAAINPGNSGGALVTASGQLIGINSAIASLRSSGSGQSGNIGIGFAIPVNEAKSIAEQLIKTGSAQHAYLGVTLGDTTATDGSSKRAAAQINTVPPGTPAANAGLRPGDAVIAIDGKPIDGSLSLVGSVRERTVGDSITLTVLRDGNRQDVKVTLAARPGQG